MADRQSHDRSTGSKPKAGTSQGSANQKLIEQLTRTIDLLAKQIASSK